MVCILTSRPAQFIGVIGIGFHDKATSITCPECDTELSAWSRVSPKPAHSKAISTPLFSVKSSISVITFSFNGLTTLSAPSLYKVSIRV